MKHTKALLYSLLTLCTLGLFFLVGNELNWTLPKLILPTASNFQSGDTFFMSTELKNLSQVNTYTTLTPQQSKLTLKQQVLFPRFDTAYYDSIADELIWGRDYGTKLVIDGEAQTLPAAFTDLFFSGTSRIAKLKNVETTLLYNIDTQAHIELAGDYSIQQVDHSLYLMPIVTLHSNPLLRVDMHTLEVQTLATFPTTITPHQLFFAGETLLYAIGNEIYTIDATGEVTLVRTDSQLITLVSDYTFLPMNNQAYTTTGTYLAYNSTSIQTLKIYPDATYSFEKIMELELPATLTNLVVCDYIIDPIAKEAVFLLRFGPFGEATTMLLTFHQDARFVSAADTTTTISGVPKKLVRISK